MSTMSPGFDPTQLQQLMQELEAQRAANTPAAVAQSLAGADLSADISSSVASMANATAKNYTTIFSAALKGQLGIAHKQIAREMAIELAQARANAKTAEGQLELQKIEAKNRAKLDQMAASAEGQSLLIDKRLESRKDAWDWENATKKAQLDEQRQQVKSLFDQGREAIGQASGSELRTVINKRLEDLPEAGGLEAAAKLRDMQNRHKFTVIQQTLRVATPAFRAMGSEPPSIEQLSTAYDKGLGFNQLIESELQKASQAQISNAKNAAHATAAETVGKRLGLAGPALETFIKDAGAKIETRTPEKMLAEAESATIAGKKKSSTLKGIAGVAVLGYLANKWLGSKTEDGQRIDPQLQMALLQRMGGASGEDEGKAAGRELQNMSRALNIIQLLGRMQGMQAESPVSVARLM